MKKDKISTLYRLSPLQEGMLFHGIYGSDSLAYTEQVVADFAEGVDVVAFKASWESLLRNHSILRSGFFHDELSVMVQCVYKTVDLPFEELDYSAFDPEEQEVMVEQYTQANRARGFDFKEPPLMRITLIRLGESHFKLVWIFHHILIDGWSMPILFEELLTAYEYYSKGAQPPARKEDRYEDFIKYIQAKDKFREEQFWKGYLDGFDTPTLLPFTSRNSERNHGTALVREIALALTKEESQALQGFAQRHHLTVNSVCQGAWALLLSKYCGSPDVLYGVTVSGRPSDLPDAQGSVGLYINTLPFRAVLRQDQPVVDWLRDLQLSHTAAREYQHSALSAIKKWQGVQGDLLDSLFVFENYPIGELIQKQWSLKVASLQAREQTNYPLTIVAGLGDVLRVRFGYNPDLMEAETVEMIRDQFGDVLRAWIASPEGTVGETDLLTADSRKALLQLCDHTPVAFPQDANLVQLFERQVAQFPQKTAVSSESLSLTYAELNARANRLARQLLDQGVQPEDLVTLCLERSTDMTVAILAVLKAGAAYVPIDADYPAGRIEFMLEDSGSKLLLTHAAASKDFVVPAGLTVLFMDEPQPVEYAADNLGIDIAPSALAYVIYTSGSTGKPKGALITHRNVVRLLFNEENLFDFGPGDVWTQFHSYCFDFSVWEMYGAILNGGRVHIIPKAMAQDTAAFAECLLREGVTVLNQTPAAFYALQEEILQSRPKHRLRYVIFGGEALLPSRLKPWFAQYPTCKLVNMYGITETTVHVTYKEIGAAEIAEGASVIGRPIPTLACYVLDEDRRLLPLGASGELYVGGEGLARAYLNRPELTEARFLPNHLTGSGRLYRTGDRARWLPSGNLEYLGRVDEQVKIRGYRIETGEIEAVLEQSGFVKQCVVLAHRDASETQSLVAYVVPEGAFDRNAIRKAASLSLPDYMVPPRIIEIGHVPLTSNGKIDRKALPNPETSSLVSTGFAISRNQAEQDLAEIWKELLKLEQVGIEDNFFELGGDSIVSIQVVSKAKRKGYHLKPRDLFLNPTIASLAAAIQAASAEGTGEQGNLRGDAGLLPVQQWFFEKSTTHRSHYNQSLLLKMPKGMDGRALEAALTAVGNRHDALGFMYAEVAGQWTQTYGGFKGKLEQVDLRSVPMGDLEAEIASICDLRQRSLDIHQGQIARMVHFLLPEAAEGDRLLLVIHHLAVDGVSWRIILQDLEQALTQAKAGEAIVLGNKSSSYRQWFQALSGFAGSPRAAAEIAYWQGMGEGHRPLPTAGAGAASGMAAEVVTLDEPRTQALLQAANFAYKTEINDLLLAALSRAVARWLGHDAIVLGMEGHGREPIDPHVDVTETVGWFTTIFPVRLTADPRLSIEDHIIATKEQLRALPNKGLGFGALSYLHPSPAIRESLARVRWDIGFNYLGQFDNVLDANRRFQAAPESSGRSVAEDFEANNRLDINGFVANGRLQFSWRFDQQDLDKEAIADVANDFIAELEAIVAHCQAQTVALSTPSDYGLLGEVHAQELREFLLTQEEGQARRDRISDLYRLSPTQEGMLFHALYDPQSAAYVMQLVVDFPQGLDLSAFRTAWNHLLRRHTILRTGFFADSLSIPVQCVYRNVEMPIEVIDLAELEAADRPGKLQAILDHDRTRGFDFTRPPLMRVTLVHLGENRYQMAWTSHHVLFDGWSKPVLVAELLTAYAAFTRGEEVEQGTEDAYADFIHHLEQRDAAGEALFWQNYLQGLEQPTFLPFVHETPDRNKGGGAVRESDLHFDPVFTQRLEEFARMHQLTVNAIMQGVWCLILSRYAGRDDVTFGITVSGRPSELRNAEKGVGLYINSLPLRYRVDPAQTVLPWLKALQEEQSQVREHQHTALNRIQKWAGFSGDLFDSILVFENYPIGEAVAASDILPASVAAIREQSNYLLTVTASVGAGFRVNFNFNSTLLAPKYVEEIKAHIEQVLKAFLQAPYRPLGEVEMLSAAETKALLQWEQPVAAPAQTVTERFAATASRVPEATALIANGVRLSFLDFDRRTNALAHHLRTEFGIGPDKVVGILCERSERQVMAAWAVLKAGGAYLPLDAASPALRNRYMLENSGATALLIDSAQLFEIEGFEGHVFALDLQLEGLEPQLAPPTPLHGPANLAYIIYTSGSTGNPKGVMVEHRNLMAYLENSLHLAHDEATSGAGSYIHLAMSFDAAITAMFVPLLAGRAAVISSGKPLEVFSDPLLLANAPYDFIKLTPSHLQLLEADVPAAALPTLANAYVLGGEALHSGQLDFLKNVGSKALIVNEYGPTESTVGCITYSFHLGEPIASGPQGISIGKPMPGVQAMVVDPQGRLLPVGIPGELCLSGAQVARGYHGQPELTAERFVQHPFPNDANAALYHTGDRARWLPSGELEFLGRIDNQVKVNGYRIELGEVEAVIRSAPGVKAAAVALQSAEGRSRLIAYIVPQSAAAAEGLLPWLRIRLPEYMLPAQVVELAEMPLTSHGKIDLRALPALQEGAAAKERTAPRNAVEADLAEIWKDLLRGADFGVEDNFFEQGGDSIISIQVVSRARRKGYQLNPYDVFRYPTIATLAEAIAARSVGDDEEEAALPEGEVGMLPIQHWFFEKDYGKVDHFNQALLLEIDKRHSAEALSKALEAVVTRQDVFQYRFVEQEGAWRQERSGAFPELEVMDLSQTPASELSHNIGEIAARTQMELDLRAGRLSRMVLLQTPESEPRNRFLWVTHHLIVDGVSWRILLDKLDAALEAMAEGREPVLGAKTTSYQQFQAYWAEAANGTRLLAELPYWERVAADYRPLPVDHEAGPSSVKDLDSATVRLDAQETEALLSGVNFAYHTQINDLLLAALAMAVGDWTGSEAVVLGLEGHGRETLEKAGNGPDVSETVGWFTNIYPVSLHLPGSRDPRQVIQAVKEDLRRVPHKGMGHGVLRYLHPDAAIRASVAKCKWDILFNYLGQVGNALALEGNFRLAKESLGKSVDESYPSGERIVVNSSVVQDELVLSFRYSTLDYDAATIQRLADNYLAALRELIAHCRAQTESEHTPSDYGLGAEIQPGEFSRFMNAMDGGRRRKEVLQTVCRLSPVQEGMLFHALYDPNSEAYIVQLIADFKEAIDREAFQNAWRYVIRNHSTFRTAFFHDELSMPVQCIYRSVEMPFTWLDLSGMGEEERAEKLAETLRKDHETKFDYKVAPLMRMILIKLGEREYKMVWTSHHILADGWSKPVLFREVLIAYDAFTAGGSPPARNEDRYEDFIAYLDTKDHAEELAFWQDYLKGFESPSLLPFNSLTYGRNSGTGTSRELDLDLDAETTQKLEALARQYQVTVNSIFQGIWFLLLSHYTGSKDVMCGVTVSGRPPEMEGVEDRIGLYIHTLPIRADLSEDKPLSNWIRDVHAGHSLSREFQYTPLSTIQKALGIQGDLFDSVLVFENFPRKAVNERKLKAEGSQTVEHTNYMLTLLALIGPEMTIRFSYNSSILPPWAVSMIREHYLHVLLQILDRPEARLKEIEVLTPAERHQMIVDFNHIPKEFEIDQTVVDLFEEQVRTHPDNVAVQFEGQQITYRELNARANRLARYLGERCGVEVGDMVPLLTLRGIDMIVGMMAVFKAGGAYVPLDAEYPIDRIADVLKHTRARTILTTSEYVDLCDTLQWELDSVAHFVRVDGGQLPDFDLLEGASKGLWNHVADRASNPVEASGWASSYTGAFFSEQEIADLVGNVVTKIEPFLSPGKRLLEVGCGSGLLVSALCKRVAHVTGTDISDAVLQQLRLQLQAQGVQNVDLQALTARQLGNLAGNRYDIIVVNSVVQYFPNFRYFREFLRQAMDLLAPDGVLFLGDLRDKDLQLDYYRSLFEGHPDAHFKVDEKRRSEVELFVRKDFLQDFFGQVERQNALEISRKIGEVENELVRFRYDALVKFSGNANPETANLRRMRHIDWDSSRLSSDNLDLQLRFSDPSYLIFTSGSTGRPKGVSIPHSALSNFLLSMRLRPGMDHRDSLLSVSTYTFDISVLDFLLPLATGAKLILTPLETVVQPEKIIEILETERPSVMQAVPTYWRVLIEQGWKGDPQIKVLSGGEAISSYLVEELIARSREYWNCYGPTETTIYCSHRKTVSLEEGINVGQPMHNTTYYVLDPDRNMVAVGVPGEVYIGGELLALGYYDDEALTRKVFIDNPHRPGERIYKSGDLGRWRPDGKLEIMGRVDTQLKIRGFRIEAEEVEMVLLRHPDIAVVVVNAWEKDGQKNLVAYIIPKEGAEIPEVSVLRNLLADSLPHYMIPAYFVKMDALPQTARGKINRKALPDPTSNRIGGGAAFEGPRTKSEEKLVDIWQSLLNLERVGIRDNFFNLGGHSLLAVRLMARINKTFNRDLPISILFDHPTIAELAPQLQLHAILSENKVLIPVNKGGTQAPIFCAPGAGGNVMSFYELGKLLEGKRPVYGFQAVGVDGKTRPMESIEDIAALNIAEMQAVHPVGPYCLAGYSFGGKVVYEMALQLRRRGFQVSELLIFDIGSPTLALLDPTERRLGSFEDSLAEVTGIWAILYGKEVRLKPEDFEGLSRPDQYARMLQALEQAGIDLSMSQLTGFTNVYLANYSCNYIPQDEEKFSFPVRLFKSTETLEAQTQVPGRDVPDDLWWGHVTTGEVDVVLLDCHHLSILNQPAVGLIFNQLVSKEIHSLL